MYDDDTPENPASAGPYQNNFAMPQQPQQMAPNGAHGSMQPPPPQQHAEAGAQFGAAPINTGYETFDPMLDADPFGLSASMHFPTQFSFDAVSR